MKNNMEYYISRDLLKTQEDPEVARYSRYESSLDGDDELSVCGDIMHSDSEGGDNDQDESDMGLLEEIVWAPTQPVRYTNELAKSSECVDLAASSTLGDASTTPDILMSIEDVDQGVLDLMLNPPTSSGPDKGLGDATLISEYPDLPTRVRLLNYSYGNVELTQVIDWLNQPTEGAESSQVISEMPTLYQVSSGMHLNEKQQKIFISVGKKTAYLAPAWARL